MNMAVTHTDVANRLRQAIELGHLTGDAVERGEAIISRLKSPVRVAVLGPRRSGKSSILNVLAGAMVLPDALPLPTVQLVFDDKNATTLTYPNKTKKTIADAAPADFVTGDPIFIEMTRNLPALRDISLLEVVMDGDASKKLRAMTWAAKRCDIALWCAPDFTSEDAKLWDQMPEGLKRRAFFVLTNADKLGGADGVRAKITGMQSTIDGRFQSVRPVAASIAVGALLADGRIEPQGFQRSGAKALLASVLEVVEMGRKTVRQAGEDLLSTEARSVPVEPEQPVAPKVEAEAKPDVEPAPKKQPKLIIEDDPSAPTDVKSEEKAEAKPAVPEKQVATDGSRDVIRNVLSQAINAPDKYSKAESDPTPDDFVFSSGSTERHDDANDDPANEGLTEQQRAALFGVVEKLSTNAAQHSRTLSEKGDAGRDEIMSGFLEDALWVSETLSDGDLDGADEIGALRTTIDDVTDLIQLMEMENNKNATVDAACLLLQVKRDVETMLVV